MTATWQPAPILFPDAELLLVDAYQALLPEAGEDDVEVDREIPNPFPESGRLVAITRDGGTSEGLVDRPRMRFNIFDVDEQAANDLARKVAALAQRVVLRGDATRAIPESGPYDVADKSKRAHRYLLIEFHTRGVAL